MADASLLEHAVARLRRLAGEDRVACKICGGETTLYDVLDFAKTCRPQTYLGDPAGVPLYYRRCRDCAFIFTDFFDDFAPEQWRAFVYNEGYHEVDPGYAEARPAENARMVDTLLRGRKHDVIGLDYGGGSGRTCARLREMGYAFDTFDPFGERWLTPESRGRYNFCTAFEVAEHTPDPRGFVDGIVSMASRERLAILIGTQAHDGVLGEPGRLAWWYAAPRNGHISLYSRQAMELLAHQFHLQYLGLSGRTHLFTRGWSASEAWLFLVRGKLRDRLVRLAGRGGG